MEVIEWDAWMILSDLWGYERRSCLDTCSGKGEVINVYAKKRWARPY